MSSPKRRWLWRTLIGVFVVAGGLYIAGYFLTGTRLPSNTVVGDVEVGGLNFDAAVAKVEGSVAKNTAQPVELVHGKETFEISPDEAKLAVDVERSVAQAGGQRSFDPRVMFGLMFGSHEHDLIVDVDDAALKGLLETIADTVEVPVTEALITFNKKAEPKPREPKAGTKLLVEDTAALVVSSFGVKPEPQELQVAPVEPGVDSDALAQAVTELAEPAMAGPVAINADDKTVDLPPTAFAPSLRIETAGSQMQPKVDPEKLAGPLRRATVEIGKAAVDAKIVIKDGGPHIIESQTGIGIDPEELAVELEKVVTKQGADRAVAIETKEVEPEFTTADAKKLGVKEKISSFTTKFPYAEYRNINQGKAAEYINGTLLKPGETFSFNEVVGERTVANGFTSGIVINGGVFREELGGGVSQVATTTYNAAFFAGLDDVEHHPHAFYIDRYPVGREATVYFGHLDLRFKNSFDTGVLVRSYVKKSAPGVMGEMTVEMWGTKVYDVKASKSPRRNFRTPGTRYDDTPACVAQSPMTGFDIDIIRTFLQNGKKIKTETNTAHYQAADQVICGKKPEPKKKDEE